MFSSLFKTKKDSTNFKIKGDGAYAGYPVLDILFKHSEKHISNKKVNEIGNVIAKVTWNPTMPLILNLHGHDPVLHWEEILNVLTMRRLLNITHLIIETTGASPIEEDFLAGLNAWIFKPLTHLQVERKVIWSNNPKLSGTKNFDIKPEYVLNQRNILGHDRFDQYFKFYCKPYRKDFIEIQSIMQQYYEAGLPQHSKVFVIPEKEHKKGCANLCLEYGFIFSNSADLDESDKASVV